MRNLKRALSLALALVMVMSMMVVGANAVSVDDFSDGADIVNKEMDNAMDGNTLSITDGAVLAAMNVADKYCKERLVSDNLRAQLKQALDENARLAKEMSEMKREARKATKEKVKAKREAKTEAKAESEAKAEDAQPAPAETQEAQTEEST